MRSFLLSTERRLSYQDCLIELSNYLTNHTDSLKQEKLNNIKGVLKIIDCLYDNVDTFIKYGDNIELKITPEKEVKATGDCEL